MSDQPLFQEVDAEEEAAAQQQLPRDDEDATGIAVVPTTGGAFQPADVAPGATTIETAPVLGAAALAEEIKRDDADDRRTE